MKNRALSKRTKSKLEECFSSIRGRKVILLLLANRVGVMDRVEKLLIELHEYFVRDFVCVLDLDDDGRMSVVQLPEYLQGFVYNFPRELVVNQKHIDKGEDVPKLPAFSRVEELAMADVVIGDYVPEAFCACAKKIPFYLWAPDYKVYFRSHPTVMPYVELFPEVLCEGEADLVERLLEMKSYDFDSEEKFANKYLAGWDQACANKLLEKL